jgi:hypothetical protein
VHAAALLILVLPAARASSAPARASDGLDELAAAVARFRGTGYEDVTSYRATLRLPDDPEDESVPLLELWRAPSSLALRAAEPDAPRAVVRGLAIYLEPLYVARASLLGADLAASVDRLRATCAVENTGGGGGREISVRFGPQPDEQLPVELRDLARLDARLDARDRLAGLSLVTREGDSIALECDYGDGALPQPDVVRWSLPGDELVVIRTTYAPHDGRALPARRSIVFPSRYDPGRTEEIRVQYENWDLEPDLDDGAFRSPDAFRYDANGLVGSD